MPLGWKEKKQKRERAAQDVKDVVVLTEKGEFTSRLEGRHTIGRKGKVIHRIGRTSWHSQNRESVSSRWEG